MTCKEFERYLSIVNLSKTSTSDTLEIWSLHQNLVNSFNIHSKITRRWLNSSNIDCVVYSSYSNILIDASSIWRSYFFDLNYNFERTDSYLLKKRFGFDWSSYEICNQKFQTSVKSRIVQKRHLRFITDLEDLVSRHTQFQNDIKFLTR